MIDELEKTISQLDSLRESLVKGGKVTINGTPTELFINNFKDVLIYWDLLIKKEQEND